WRKSGYSIVLNTMAGASKRKSLFSFAELLFRIIPFIIGGTNQCPFHCVIFVLRHCPAPEILCLSRSICQNRFGVLLISNVPFTAHRDVCYGQASRISPVVE